MFRGTLTPDQRLSARGRQARPDAQRRRRRSWRTTIPSGVAEPSRADEFLTQTLKSALALVDVRVLDHLVVAPGDGRLVRRAGSAVSAARSRVPRPRARVCGARRDRRRCAERAPRRGSPRWRASASAEPPRSASASCSPWPSAASCRCARRRPAPSHAPRPERRCRASVSATKPRCCRNRFPTSSTSSRCSRPTTRCRSGVASIGPEVVRKLRRGVWALQARARSARPAPRRGARALSRPSCATARPGLRCVRIVHGKGLGSPGREPVLKGKVQHWLVQRDEVLAFTQARAADGGHGALIVLLQPVTRFGTRRVTDPPRSPLQRRRRTRRRACD